MNVVRFNDEFEPAVKSTDWGPEFWKEVSTAPLFYHELDLKGGIAPEVEKLRQSMAGTPLPELPFECLRVFLKLKSSTITTTLKTMVRVVEGQWLVLATGDYDGPRHLVNQKLKVVMRAWIPSIDGDLNYQVYSVADRQWLTESGFRGLKVNKERADWTTAEIAAFLQIFALQAMAPTIHIAEVHPASGEPRSVEWIKARTHYTLITHGHPANSKAIRSGESVKSDAQGELTRMAHNRRAHYRTYKADRYRFVRGQRKPVRATWVGPKEWKDEGGKQIYRILEPVVSEEIAA